MSEHTLDLPVSPETTYYDFERLPQVRELMLLNPTMTLHDVTPDGMPDRYTDEEIMSRQRANMLDSGEEFSYNLDELDT
jgi:hypothetical protein